MSYNVGMYTPVQVLERPRRSLRRAVSLECHVLAEGWDEPVRYRVRDLSPAGMFLESPLPLDPGTRMYVALRPTGWRGSTDVVARAVVRRVELRRRRDEGPSSGMGVAFEGLPEDDVEALDDCLRGLPPRLPSAATRQATGPVRHTTLWVDQLD